MKLPEQQQEQLYLGDWLKRIQETKKPRTFAEAERVRRQDNTQHYPPEAVSKPRTTSFRSNVAFRSTINAYLSDAKEKAENAGKPFFVRMWTITSAETLAYSVFLKRWNAFLTSVKRSCPGFSCIRVVEVHPGEDFEVPGEPGRWETISHGLHIHFVCQHYLSQKQVQKIAHRARLGHVSVTGKCAKGGNVHTIESAVNYLSKYLRKGLFENCAGLRHRRIWSPVNYERSVGVRDIVITSRWKVVYERLSLDDDFCFFNFKLQAKIANEGEIISRLIDAKWDESRGELNRRLILSELKQMQTEGLFGGWSWNFQRYFWLLAPAKTGTRNPRDIGYDYLAGKGEWPGVKKYLDWLRTAPGRAWSHEQNDKKKERDKERQRERRRELAEDKKMMSSNVSKMLSD